MHPINSNSNMQFFNQANLIESYNSGFISNNLHTISSSLPTVPIDNSGFYLNNNNTIYESDNETDHGSEIENSEPPKKLRKISYDATSTVTEFSPENSKPLSLALENMGKLIKEVKKPGVLIFNQKILLARLRDIKNGLKKHASHIKDIKKVQKYLHNQHVVEQKGDVCLISRDQQEIYANSSVLEQSKTLKLHLSEQSKVSKTHGKTVLLLDFPLEDIRSVIYYLYTRKLALTADNLLGIYAIAHDLEIEDIQEKCLNFVKEIITPDNALNLFVQFQVYTDHPIYNFLLEEVLKKASQVFNLNKLDIGFIPQNILVKILGHDLLNLKERRIFDVIKAWLEKQPELDEATFNTMKNLLRLGLMKSSDLLEVSATKIKEFTFCTPQIANQYDKKLCSSKLRATTFIKHKVINNPKLELELDVTSYYFIKSERDILTQVILPFGEFLVSIIPTVQPDESDESCSIYINLKWLNPKFQPYSVKCSLLSKTSFNLNQNQDKLEKWPQPLAYDQPECHFCFSKLTPSNNSIRDGHLRCRLNFCFDTDRPWNLD